MMQPEIDQFSNSVPKSPIRELLVSKVAFPFCYFMNIDLFINNCGLPFTI